MGIINSTSRKFVSYYDVYFDNKKIFENIKTLNMKCKLNIFIEDIVKANNDYTCFVTRVDFSICITGIPKNNPCSPETLLHIIDIVKTRELRQR
jgi:hypothetical protein